MNRRIGEENLRLEDCRENVTRGVSRNVKIFQNTNIEKNNVFLQN